MGAIRAVHGLAGAADPGEDGRVREAVAQARDRLKNSRPNARAPLLFEDLKRIIGHIDSGSHIDRRDRALILLGVAGALAPRELEVLDVEDATFTAHGLVICIRQRADTNEAVTLQAKSGPALDAVGALREWLENAELHGGPMFRQMNRHNYVQADRLNPASITNIIKRRASAAGIPPERYSAQSLRSGGIRAAAGALHTEHDLAAFSRIKTRCALRRYTRLG
ncbi:MAG: hypothetical protein WKF96_06625 [Solirubrobacteraceae bacterium]